MFGGVGAWYFSQVPDEEVLACLGQQHDGHEVTSSDRSEVTIEHGGVTLVGDLTLPPDPRGLVLFAHGSGSSRKSSRNVAVAHALEQAGFGTLLFDLLTVEESEDRRNVFDISLLSARLIGATCWAQGQPELGRLDIGYFGASTGAAAALVAAAELQKTVSAVVSRGGRPDMADEWLSLVHAPTLLIVGGADTQVLELNKSAMRMMSCQNELIVVPGAGHLFEEPGALEVVSETAIDWFAGFSVRPTGSLI